MDTACRFNRTCHILWICGTLLIQLLWMVTGTPDHNYNDRSIDQVHGPLCYNCHGVDRPDACADIKICGVGEVCMLHGLTSSSGTRSYEASCQSDAMCTMIGQMAQIGKRAAALCHVCCSDDFCNNDCAANNQPPVIPTGSVDTRLLCYACSIMEDPSACRHHTTCALGQMCIIRETGVSIYGAKQYQSACETKEVCHALETLNSVKSQVPGHSYCFTCCNSDLCNNHCDHPTIMTSPTTTTSPTTLQTTTTRSTTKPHTHPTTTVKSGPTCWSCTSMTSPTDCHHQITCAAGEVCTLSEVIDPSSMNRHYESSCESKVLCEKYSKLLESHFGHGQFCKICCELDSCNNYCPGTLATVAPATHAPTTHVPTTPAAHSTLRCFDCQSISDPTRCRQTAMCGDGQVCMLHEIVQNGQVTSMYTSSCRSLAVCQHIGHLMISEATRTGHSYCHMCCTSDMCNRECPPRSSTPSPPPPSTHSPTTTHQAVTPHHTTTTDALNPILLCYGCAVLDDPTTCRHVVPCITGEVCTVHQIGNHAGSMGQIYYTASCERKQLCMMYSDLASQGLSSCHSCCDTQLCNTQCGPPTTTAAITTPIPAGGPLECYSCPMMTDPSACSHTKTCDQSQVCMLHELISSSTSGKYFEASCETKTICESVVRVLNGGHNGNGHVFCTYCCNTSRCNNHCEITSHTTSLPVVDGIWSAWTSWSTCSVTCGSGLQISTRTCDNPAPQNHGNDCIGQNTQQQQCHLQGCPVDGHWSNWGQWSTCTASCGSSGQKLRTRACDNPPPQNHGASCNGQSTVVDVCNLHPCPIDGAWSTWSTWSLCSATCGPVGQKARTRSCSNPAPQHNGVTCPGDQSELANCGLADCPGSTGPLECYSCDLMNEPHGCSHTTTCDSSQVCMLHEKSSSMAGTKYYEASCERKTVCESVVRLVTAAALNHGHMFCTYCCDTSRCNNHCELPTTRAITTTTRPEVSTPPLSPGDKCRLSSYTFVDSVGLCFKIVEVVESYTTAITMCQHEGASLATVQDEVGWKLITFQLTVLTRVSGMSLYMGGYDVFNNGTYYWPDGSLMTFAHWGIGEPRVMNQGDRMPCVVVDLTDMAWRTDDCHTKRPFICTKRVH